MRHCAGAEDTEMSKRNCFSQGSLPKEDERNGVLTAMIRISPGCKKIQGKGYI